MSSSARTGTSTQAAPRTNSLPLRQANGDLTVSLTDLPEGFLLRLEGVAGARNLGPMDSHLMRVLACRPQFVVVDFSELTLLSSLAMGSLVQFRRNLARWGGRVKLAGVRPSIHESLEAAGLADLFEFHTTVVGAVAAEARMHFARQRDLCQQARGICSASSS